MTTTIIKGCYGKIFYYSSHTFNLRHPKRPDAGLVSNAYLQMAWHAICSSLGSAVQET